MNHDQEPAPPNALARNLRRWLLARAGPALALEKTEAMELRKACALAVKPICAAALVGVLATLVRLVASRESLEGGPLQWLSILLVASVWVSLLFLNPRRPNTVWHHGAIAFVAGLLMGFPMVKDASFADRQGAWMAMFIVALFGSLAGIVFGAVRRGLARDSGQPEKWCDVELIAKENDAFCPRVSAWRRLFSLAIFGIGIVVVYFLVAIDPAVIDSRGVAETLADSPDCRLLATARREVILNERSRIRDLRFSDDGRKLRTVDFDDTVCVWDATNLALVQRVSIPAGYVVGDIRPSDGRYALCYDAIDPTRPVQVVDLDTGKSICQATLPLNWTHRGPPPAFAGPVYWLSDSEILCTGWAANDHRGLYQWWRLNYQTGELLPAGDAAFRPGDVDLDPGYGGQVTEDGKHLFVTGGRGKGDPPQVAGQINLETFQTTNLGSIDRPVNGPFGLVPGGRYFHLGLHVYDRRSLNLVAAKDFPHDRVEIGAVTFSPDGSRYAVSLRQYWLEISPRTVVMVHETLTSRNLAAFLPARVVAHFRFSQDGTQLAVVYDDGTLEVRSVP